MTGIRIPLGRDDAGWYSRHARTLARLRYDCLVAAGMIEGALHLHLEYEDSHGPVVKTAFFENVEPALESALLACGESAASPVEALAAVARTITSATMMEARQTRTAAQHFFRQLHRIAGMIDDLQSDFESMIAAGR